jgi:hypothetical protein
MMSKLCVTLTIQKTIELRDPEADPEEEVTEIVASLEEDDWAVTVDSTEPVEDDEEDE